MREGDDQLVAGHGATGAAAERCAVRPHSGPLLDRRRGSRGASATTSRARATGYGRTLLVLVIVVFVFVVLVLVIVVFVFVIILDGLEVDRQLFRIRVLRRVGD